MNWQAIGAIGEVIGGAGVMFTLLYLAVQVRHNTAEMKATASESIAYNLREWLRPMIEDPEISRIFRVGTEGWEGFGPDEKARFFHIIFVWLKNIEGAHYHFRRGRLDPEVWMGWEVVIHSYLAGPGVQAYWANRRQGFSLSFQKYVDSIPPGPRFPRVGEVTGESASQEVASGDGAAPAE